VISVDRLTKVYGQRVAVWQVSFEVAKGEIVGFLGPNGAGKTTTMRMITGFLPPSAGTARIAGHDILQHPIEAKARLGYLCETPPVYREMRVRSYLRFVAEIKRVPAARRRSLVDRAVDLCGLGDVADRVVGNLSKGYRQRVGLAQAILHKPDVLILDEPTVGLDARQIPEIRNVIRGLVGEQTVVLSTHILPEVQLTCSRVVIIDEGQVVYEGSIDSLVSGLGRSQGIRLRTAREAAGLDARLAALPGVRDVRRDGETTLVLTLDGGDETRERVVAETVASGAGVVELARQTASLEEVFLKIVTHETQEAS
jgi:ABC-2 type transport system ATP-binding protein